MMEFNTPKFQVLRITQKQKPVKEFLHYTWHYTLNQLLEGLRVWLNLEGAAAYLMELYISVIRSLFPFQMHQTLVKNIPIWA